MSTITQKHNGEDLDCSEIGGQGSGQIYFTVKQFANAEPAFTEASLRGLIFKANSRNASLGNIKGNGLIETGALIRIGRKVLIHRSCFLRWLQRND